MTASYAPAFFPQGIRITPWKETIVATIRKKFDRFAIKMVTFVQNSQLASNDKGITFPLVYREDMTAQNGAKINRKVSQLVGHDVIIIPLTLSKENSEREDEGAEFATIISNRNDGNKNTTIRINIPRTHSN